MSAISAADAAAFRELQTQLRTPPVALPETQPIPNLDPLLGKTYRDLFPPNPDLKIFEIPRSPEHSIEPTLAWTPAAWGTTPSPWKLPPPVSQTLPLSGVTWPSSTSGATNPFNESPIPDPVFIVTQSRWPAGLGASWGLEQKIGWLQAIMHPYRHFYWVQQQLSKAIGMLYEQYGPVAGKPF